MKGGSTADGSHSVLRVVVFYLRSLSLSFFLSVSLISRQILYNKIWREIISFQIFSFLSVTDGDDGDGAGLEQTKDM